MSKSERELADIRARNGFLIITAVRFSGIALIMLGFAISGGVIDLPWIAAPILALAGFVDFFFVPRLVARRWNAPAGDRE